MKRSCFFKKIIFLAAITCLFFSCAQVSETTSFLNKLDEADRYISQTQTDSALKILKKLEKKALNPLYAIGLYRRYMQLGESARAEKILTAALKRNPDNLELCAIYSSFLTRRGRLDEAFKLARPLAGTKYGSIYSEVFLRKIIKDHDKKDFSFYASKDFLPVYFDAYNGSHDNGWLRNAAVVHLINGEYADAASLTPSDKKSAADALFWALSLYDAGKYGDAAENLLTCRYLSEQKKSSGSALVDDNLTYYLPEKGCISQIEVSSLLSDCYVCMNEDEEAQKIRTELISSLSQSNEKNTADEDKLLSVIYLNSALFSLSREDYIGAHRMLTFVVNKWPDFVNALVCYGNFAYNMAKLELNDPLTRAVRDAGVKSLDMRRFDDLPRIPVTDAIARIDESLKRAKNDVLYVAKLDLEDKISEETDDRIRLSKMYRVLEKNSIGTDQYPPELTQYAVHTLLTLDKIEDARSMFKKYLASRADFDKSRPFGEQCAENLDRLYLWEVQYAAWFAAYEKNATLAKRLYEYAVYENGFAPESSGTEISPDAAVSSAINLAMIYSSTGLSDKALELYGKASGRASDLYTKAEIMYRIACIYVSKGETEAAVRSLQYCLYLNPGYAHARLLLNKIRK